VLPAISGGKLMEYIEITAKVFLPAANIIEKHSLRRIEMNQ
jgi:hypothetical protein